MSPSLRDADRTSGAALESRSGASPSTPRALRQAERARALMIDDEFALARAMEVRLESIGVELEAALTGAEGVAQAQRIRPDLILLDVRLPDMDGFEALRRLRALPAVAECPVVFVTASASESTRKRAREAGACAFFAKPFDADRLMQTIELELAGRERGASASEGREQ